jgi:hypothetical protein
MELELEAHRESRSRAGKRSAIEAALGEAREALQRSRSTSRTPLAIAGPREPVAEIDRAFARLNEYERRMPEP